MIFLKIVLLASIYLKVEAIRVMVIGDLYVNPNASGSCTFGYCLENGVYGKPTTNPLLNTVFDDAKYVIEGEYNVSVNKFVKKVERDAKKNNVSFDEQFES